MKVTRFSAHNNCMQQLWQHVNVVLTLVVVSFLSIAPVGYHIVVLNVPEKVIQNALNASMYRNFKWSMTEAQISVFWSVIVSSQSVGALLACLLIVPLSNRHGTKTCIMLLNSVILLLASVIMACAAVFEFALFLLAGRVIIGLYTGLSNAFIPIFMQELAPTVIKGALSCFMHIAVCLGAMLAGFLSLNSTLGTDSLWGLMLAIPALFGVMQVTVAIFIPDTPNHLMSKGDRQTALSSIRFYYGVRDAPDDDVILEYEQLVAKMPVQVSYYEAVTDRATLWGIIVGMVVSAAQIFCGSMATVSYSTSMFTSVAFTPSLVALLPAFGSVLSAILTLPALYLVEAYGRRIVFLTTLFLCVASDFSFVLFSLLSQHFAEIGTTVWSLLFAMAFFVFGVGYNVGVGPMAYFIPGELVRPQAVSVALGAAVAVNWLCTLITTLLYYPLNVAIGGWSYLLFAIPSTIFALFLWRFLPETKDLHIDAPEFASFSTNRKPEEYGTFIIKQY